MIPERVAPDDEEVPEAARRYGRKRAQVLSQVLRLSKRRRHRGGIELGSAHKPQTAPGKIIQPSLSLWPILAFFGVILHIGFLGLLTFFVVIWAFWHFILI